MSGDFDALRAAREELMGLNDVLKTMREREMAAEARIGRAEIELNDIRKLKGYCLIEIEKMQARIKAIEDQRS